MWTVNHAEYRWFKIQIMSDHGGGRLENPYCKYCTDESGNLKSKEEVREGMINFQMQQSPGKTREEAEKEVDAHMSQMPVWQTQAGTPTEPIQPSGVPPTRPLTTETPTETPPAEEEQV